MVKTPEVWEIFSESQIICFYMHVGLEFYFTLLRVAALFNSMAVFLPSQGMAHCCPACW